MAREMRKKRKENMCLDVNDKRNVILGLYFIFFIFLNYKLIRI